ncbi:MAG: outer membrane lipoprotein carrier protein LolA [Thermodesulfobacteriaceae bacterium]|nr:outer membrane lipoprotein carrier protein LolA [Thermodesulfobacteriaceae bacterium]MDW8136719.1 outer membrane lipoprotein carrier protein LolA [Thermodesulfobacterium sp.]
MNLKAQSVEEVLDQIQLFYQQINTLKAEFLQETRFPSGKIETRTGKLWMKKPGRLRWEYLSPEKFIILSDGKNFYLHYPEEQQTFSYSIHEYPASQLILGFMNGLRDLKKDLRLESFKILEKDFWEIHFVPNFKDNLNIAKIILIVTSNKGEVKQIQVVYTTGERVKINFKKVEYNLILKDSIFNVKSLN